MTAAIEQYGIRDMLNFLELVASRRRRPEFHSRCRRLTGVHSGTRHARYAGEKQ
jgi:hypothetical protein